MVSISSFNSGSGEGIKNNWRDETWYKIFNPGRVEKSRFKKVSVTAQFNLKF